MAMAMAATTPQSAILPGSHFVAMGSSFAAGPGVGGVAAKDGGRCGRSTANYAQLLALRFSLKLTDVSCSGATTGNLLARWNELPAQIDAVKRDTRLVTLTIGGNDVAYIGRLGAASCAAARPKRDCLVAPAGQPDFGALEERLVDIAREIRTRAPMAWIVYFDYVHLLPSRGACPLIPLTSDGMSETRRVQSGLNRAIANAARRSDAIFVPASMLSAKHHACAAEPWVSGLIDRNGNTAPVPLHLNDRGMAALADALATRLLRVGN